MDHPIVILGYGNSLRCDDGAGPAVVTRLRARLAGLFSTHLSTLFSLDASGEPAPLDATKSLDSPTSHEAPSHEEPSHNASLASTPLLLDAHQLLPEHAEPLSRAGRVVLVDACCDESAGEVRVHRLRHNATLADARALLDPHALSPAALAGLCRDAFGRSPRMVLVTIGVANLDIGDRLSPCVDAAVDRVADRIATHVERRAARAARSVARNSGGTT